MLGKQATSHPEVNTRGANQRALVLCLRPGRGAATIGEVPKRISTQSGIRIPGRRFRTAAPGSNVVSQVRPSPPRTSGKCPRSTRRRGCHSVACLPPPCSGSGHHQMDNLPLCVPACLPGTRESGPAGPPNLALGLVVCSRGCPHPG